VSYPSRRRRRIGGDRERYRQLVAEVLRPEEPERLRIEVARGRDRSRASDRTVEGAPSPAALRVAGELAGSAGERVLGSGGR
jgi:hypothetical protein